MLKRIHIDHLQLGMYLHDFCGSWMEHPFWHTKFLLTDAQDLARIRATKISEVWIDTQKGCDVAPGTAAVNRAEAEAQVDCQLAQAAHSLGDATQAIVQATSMQEELLRAVDICSSAKHAVVNMFSEARMGQAVDTSSADHLVTEINDSIARNPGALINLARLKTADDYTYMHSVAVCALMVALARQLGFAERIVRLAGLAGLLHDLGKAHIPLSVLNKPGKLTDEEFDLMRGHPAAGHALLDPEQVHPMVRDACLHHHEKVDGTGYPDRLKGDQIQVLARMAAICDVYDAITSNRPYKSGWDPAESLHRMAEWSHNHFDHQLFQAFVKTIGIYPAGSLVRLSSQRLGVVTEQSSGTLLKPKLKVFYSLATNSRIPEQVLDLSAPDCLDCIVRREDPTQWCFADLNHLWTGIDNQAR